MADPDSDSPSEQALPDVPASPDPPAWRAATALLDEMQRLTEGAFVLRAAMRAGLLAALLEPATARDIASRTGIAPGLLEAALGVLESFGVATRSTGSWSLSAGWAAMVREESPVHLDAVLEMGRVRSAMFERSLDGGLDYWSLDPGDRLSVARGVSFNPSSEVIGGFLRGDLEQLDGVLPALGDGGSVLELGCGVGSRLTALALRFPAMHGVGVELDPALVEYGRRRATELGVGDRVEYVVGDATAYRSSRRFDLVNWSQFFFPEGTRKAALETARELLRPGGWITAPVIWAEPPADRVGSSAQELALEGMLLHTWGVPARTTEQVAAELESAGFVETRIDTTPYINLVRGRQPAAEPPSGEASRRG